MVEAVEQAIADAQTDRLCRALVEAANEAGGEDNITVAVVSVVAADA